VPYALARQICPLRRLAPAASRSSRELGRLERFDDDATGASDAEALPSFEDLIAGVGAGDPEFAGQAGHPSAPLDRDAEDPTCCELVQVPSRLLGTGRRRGMVVMGHARHDMEMELHAAAR
jgi:hypothetical protein